MTNLPPLHPGELLLEEFLVPLELTQEKLARDIDVPTSRISAIIRGKRAITPDTALRLAEYFGTSARFWLNLQNTYDLRHMRETVWEGIKKRIRPLPSTSSTISFG